MLSLSIIPPAAAPYLPFGLGLVAIWLCFGLVRKFRERTAALRKYRATHLGEADPVSLHPRIDLEKCVGCGACTHACPEGRIIGMIGGKAHLLDPASCIGHGACEASCPVGAIDLVFGSARRGVDIPVVSPSFESSMPGIYIAGELGGMGLIANAIEQGQQAIDAIAERDNLRQPGIYDVIIVGAGPAGMAASLAAKAKGLRALTLEQDTLGGTVARYPRAKIVMTRPANLPLFGKVKLRRARKERLLALWRQVQVKTGIEIRERVRVDRIVPADGGFEVETTAGPARASTILLAIGRRGLSRQLGVPGEHLPKVTYGLDDPARYRDRHVLVVGGGDSAAEAAIALARERVACVTLSYRGQAFTRPRPATRQRLEDFAGAGNLRLMLGSELRSIEAERVVLDQGERMHMLRNDAVIICAGGTLPMALLAGAGVRVERKFGTA